MFYRRTEQGSRSAHRSPISPVGSIGLPVYVRPEATSAMSHVTVARSSAVGPSLLRVHDGLERTAS